MTAEPRFANLPRRMKGLPLDPRGFPVPWFVATLPDGTRDFRVSSVEKIAEACRFQRCWICGHALGRHLVFVIGPMCAINRISAEPPSHLDCAQFAAEHCPFLSQPLARRNERDFPDIDDATPGIMIERNPGVCCLWTTKHFSRVPAPGGYLIKIGEALHARWYCEGRPATRAEVLASVDSGYPLLRKIAQEENAIAELERQRERFFQLLQRFPPEG